MKNILFLPIILIIIIVVSVLGLLSLSEPSPELTMGDSIENFQRDLLYVEENTNHGFTEREYSAVMRLANHDLDRAVEIFNDPEYPEKFYGEDGTLP